MRDDYSEYTPDTLKKMPKQFILAVMGDIVEDISNIDDEILCLEGEIAEQAKREGGTQSQTR
jgi:hypothetical protein